MRCAPSPCPARTPGRSPRRRWRAQPSAQARGRRSPLLRATNCCQSTWTFPYCLKPTSMIQLTMLRSPPRSGEALFASPLSRQTVTGPKRGSIARAGRLSVRWHHAFRRRPRPRRPQAKRAAASDHHDARLRRQQGRWPGMGVPAIRIVGLCGAAIRLSRLRRERRRTRPRHPDGRGGRRLERHYLHGDAAGGRPDTHRARRFEPRRGRRRLCGRRRSTRHRCDPGERPRQRRAHHPRHAYAGIRGRNSCR